VVGAAVAVVLAMAAAFAIGLHGRGDDSPDRSAGAAPASQDSGEPSPSGDADQPTEKAMVDFVEGYIQTAVADPAAAFEMLTPAFQEHSGGMEGYVGFWGDVRSARILDISADPDQLEVSYTYRYNKPHGGPVEDDVVLKLTYRDGTYLIDREL
jgi:hypothetical protein